MRRRLEWRNQGASNTADLCANHEELGVGYRIDAFHVVSLLKTCAKEKDLEKGYRLHSYIEEHKFLEENSFIASTLVSMYARCGALNKAQEVIEQLPVRDVVTWTALIAGYAQQGQGTEALKCFDSMQRDGHSPDAYTFTCVLKACGSTGAAAVGEQFHDKIVHLGILEKNIILGNTLVDMYARCGALAKAQAVLEALLVRNVVTWTALMTGYVQQGRGDDALKCFDSMQHDGHTPNVVTFTCALKACGITRAAAKGEQIHDQIVSLDMLEKSIVLGTAVVDMYARCGALNKARQVFSQLPSRDIVSWNAIIAAYTQEGQGEEALKCYDSMEHDGHSPDTFTFTSALKACGSLGAAAKGEHIHDKIVSLGMLGKSIVVGSALVDMYTRCGALAKACQVFTQLPVRDVVMWTTLIEGYCQQGQGEGALKCFDSMQRDNQCPDDVTFTCILQACGIIGTHAKGKQIHHEVVSQGILVKNAVLGNALVDMYARCGAPAKAQQVFMQLPVRDVVTWSALIAGYALHGQTVEVVDLFDSMQSKGVTPESTTFVCMLGACSHSGLSDEAELYFSSMSNKYGLVPDLEHYCCMVDLFSRSGKLERALSVIERMPAVEYLPVWLTLLGACRKWEEMQIGKLAFEHAFHLDKSISAIYVSMEHIYRAAGMQEDAHMIGAMRATNKAWEGNEKHGQRKHIY